MADRDEVVLAMQRRIKRVDPFKALAKIAKMIDAARATGDFDKGLELGRLQGIWIERLSNPVVNSLEGAATRKAGHAKRAPLHDLLRKFVAANPTMKNAKIAAAFLSKYPQHDSDVRGKGPDTVGLSHLIQRLIPAIKKYSQ
jgi:hypothetical protein